MKTSMFNLISAFSLVVGLTTSANAQTRFGWFQAGQQVNSQAVDIVKRVDQVYQSLESNPVRIPNFGTPESFDVSETEALIAGAGGSPLISWCSDVIGVLDRAYGNAVRATSAENFEASVAFLTDGLRQALTQVSSGYYKRLLLARAIWRGVELSKTLQQNSTTRADVRAANLFLEKYYQLVRTIYYSVDSNYMIPYGNCFGCATDLIYKFETELVNTARSQIEIALVGLSVNGTPMGASNGRIFLKGLQKSLVFAADTLLISPYQNLYHCVIVRMIELVRAIQSGLNADPRLVAPWAFEQASAIAASLQVRQCGGIGGYNPIPNPYSAPYPVPQPGPGPNLFPLPFPQHP